MAAPPPGGDAISAGNRFVDLLAHGNFAGASTDFDSAMKAALPEAKLKETWQALQEQAGPFQKRLRSRVVKLGPYDAVLVTSQFEKTRLDVKVVFDANRHIAGLWFVPSPPETSPAGLPAYIRTNAFEETDFTVGQGEWRLPGTLSLPKGVKGPVPAVVLVHGSGPNDRDETVGACKPFRDLAWGLASKGIAVLRYDKRTLVHKTKFSGATLKDLTVQQETIEDALSAAAQLRATRGIDARRVFVLGHSLGGMVAPRIGQADPKLAGLIILAGASRPLEDLILEQTRYLASLRGEPSPTEQARLDAIAADVAKVKKLTAADAGSSRLLFNAPAAYWLDLRAHDPVAEARSLKQPLLILQGGRDYQATTADFKLWKEGLGTRPDVTLKLYPNLNHLFVAGEGKSTPAEYEREGYVAAEVIADIAAWISER